MIDTREAKEVGAPALWWRQDERKVPLFLLPSSLRCLLLVAVVVVVVVVLPDLTWLIKFQITSGRLPKRRLKMEWNGNGPVQIQRVELPSQLHVE